MDLGILCHKQSSVGRASDSGARGPEFKPNWHWVVSLSKTHQLPIVLVNTQEAVVLVNTQEAVVLVNTQEVVVTEKWLTGTLNCKLNKHEKQCS